MLADKAMFFYWLSLAAADTGESNQYLYGDATSRNGCWIPTCTTTTGEDSIKTKKKKVYLSWLHPKFPLAAAVSTFYLPKCP